MIHVFNSTGSGLAMSLNGPQVPAPERTTPDNGYKPFSRTYELTKLEVRGKFNSGDNTVALSFLNFQPPKPTGALYTVHIPRDIAVGTPLVLFLFVNGFTLMRSSGEVLENRFDPERRSAGAPSNPIATN